MQLQAYLRNKIVTRFNSLVKKEECEICGNSENLHVHHLYQFKHMLEDTLCELELPLKDTDDYTEVELKNITEKILGKHLYYEYETLCYDCHISKAHKKDYKFDEQIEFDLDKMLYHNKEQSIQISFDDGNELNPIYYPLGKSHFHISHEELEHYLESLIGVYIIDDLKEDLINKIGTRNEKGRIIKSISLLNEYLEKEGLSYRISSIRTRINGNQVRAWKILKSNV